MFFLLLIVLTAFILFFFDQVIISHKAINTLDDSMLLELQQENAKLKGILASIIPEESKTLYEGTNRELYTYSSAKKNGITQKYSTVDVLGKGEDISFDIILSNPDYKRPLYSPRWKGAYYRSWLYLPYKNAEARHKLFIFPLGGSANYDFTGSLGLEKAVFIDAHRKINFLVYGFDVRKIRRLGEQIVLAGKPSRTGVQIISVVQDELLESSVDESEYLFHLVTPFGYELDYVPGQVIRYEHLMKLIKENTVGPSSLDSDSSLLIERLQKQNRLLEEELAYFIPPADEAVTQEKCRLLTDSQTGGSFDMETIIRKGKETSFEFIYADRGYKRPVYHPSWKQNHRKKWCFIPEQVCLNSHRLFAIPTDSQSRTKLLGMLAFPRSIKMPVPSARDYIIYNFVVHKALILGNQVIFTGIPARAGLQVISLNHSFLKHTGAFSVHLASLDGCEIDVIP